MADRKWAAILLFLTLVAAPCFALDPAPDVLCLIVPGQGTDPGLQRVVTDAVLVQLARRKLSAEVVDPSVSNVSTVKTALALARQEGAQVLVVGNYMASQQALSLSFQAFDPASRRHFDAVSEAGPIDISMDSVVSKALSEALEGVPLTPSVGAADPSDPQGAGGSAGQPGAVSTGAGSTSSSAGAVQVGTALPGAGTDRTVRTSAIPPTSWSQRKPSIMGVYAGFAPLVTTGPVAQYAQYGWTALVSADVAFSLWSGSFGAGILSGACWFDATGLATTARVLLVPVGLDLRFTLERPDSPWLALHLSGGPAALQATTAWSADLSKAVGYALAGLVMDLPFTASIGMTLETSYVVFFESASLPIMGFIPEVSFHARL